VSSRFALRSSGHRLIPLAAGVALLAATPLAGASAGAQPCAFGGPGCGAHGHMGMRGAGGPGRGGAGMSIERLLAHAEELGVTEAQQTKLRDIRKQSPGVLSPKRQAVEEARLALQDLMAEEKSTTADLERAHAKLVEARSALQAAQFHLRMQVRDVLTPEQRTKLKEKAAALPGDGTRRMMHKHRFGAFSDDAEPDFESF